MPRAKKQAGNDSTEKTQKRGRGRPKSEIPMMRKTYHLPTELAEKVESYSYWARMTISAVLTDALQQYFKEKNRFPEIQGRVLKIFSIEISRIAGCPVSLYFAYCCHLLSARYIPLVPLGRRCT